LSRDRIVFLLEESKDKLSRVSMIKKKVQAVPNNKTSENFMNKIDHARDEKRSQNKSKLLGDNKPKRIRKNKQKDNLENNKNSSTLNSSLDSKFQKSLRSKSKKTSTMPISQQRKHLIHCLALKHPLGTSRSYLDPKYDANLINELTESSNNSANLILRRVYWNEVDVAWPKFSSDQQRKITKYKEEMTKPFDESIPVESNLSTTSIENESINSSNEKETDNIKKKKN